MELTVATFNIYRHDDFQSRLPAILRVLGDADAGIVCLQEVPPRQGTAARIAAALGYPHVAESPFLRPEDGWSEALAVLSRYAIAEQEPIELRAGVWNGLRVQLDTPPGRLDVYNTHLHPRDPGIRQGEVSRILERMGREPSVAAVLCGDFNAVPGGPTMALVWPHLAPAFEMARGHHPETTFPTPLRPLQGRQPGFSERREAPPADDESAAKAAIDYVLVRRAQFRALDARVLGTEPVEGVWPSDHYGVWVRIEGRH